MKDHEKIVELPELIQQVATASAAFAFAPEPEKLLYVPGEELTLPADLIPPLPASSTQSQQRQLQPGNIYVYDMEEDKNFWIASIPATSEVKEVSTSEVSTPSASITTNATAGKAIIPNGSTELTINSPHVDAASLIYVTPTGDPQNQVLYVKAKAVGQWFTVAINQPLDHALEFNWWIIKLE